MIKRKEKKKKDVSLLLLNKKETRLCDHSIEPHLHIIEKDKEKKTKKVFAHIKSTIVHDSSHLFHSVNLLFSTDYVHRTTMTTTVQHRVVNKQRKKRIESTLH